MGVFVSVGLVLLGYERGLCAEVLGAFAAEISRSLRWRAKRLFGLKSVEEAHTGAITFVQRFDSALRLNVHSHVLALDGVYVERAGDAGEAGALVFMALPAPARRRCSTSHSGPRREFGRVIAGFNVHAKVAIPAGDRVRLERLCRYLARSPIAQDRLTSLADGRLRYEIGTSLARRPCAVDLWPLELLTPLAAMVPPPRFHMIRFHGVVSSHSSLRSRVVPQRPRAA